MLSTAVSIVGNVLSTSLMFDARLKRRVPLRVERLGLRHAAGHPQHDDGIGRPAGVTTWRAGAVAAARSPGEGGFAAGQRQRERGTGVAPMNPRRLTRA